MANVRVGVVGMGTMGNVHAAYLAHGAVPQATLTAVCDRNGDKVAAAVEKCGGGGAGTGRAGGGVQGFTDYPAMLRSGACDAVLIAAQHYEHAPMSVAAFEAGGSGGKGLHVMVEKPLAVSVSKAREVVAAYAKHPHLKFGIMYNQRANPMYQKLRELILAGELGKISRITWIVTHWFRTWAYYGSSKWRGTWKGEGGGVLINQCPHNLDLLQWVTGLMPRRVTAVGFAAKTHPIETEDEVSAILECENGAVGHFITSTGEYPGTNRLEICGSRGKVIAENGKLLVSRVKVDVQEYNRSSLEAFGTPEVVTEEAAFQAGTGGEHQAVLQDFVAAILTDLPNDKLLAPGPEGLKGLEIGNAMMMAGLTRTPVDLPVNGAAFDAFIEEMARTHHGKKNIATAGAKMNVSF